MNAYVKTVFIKTGSGEENIHELEHVEIVGDLDRAINDFTEKGYNVKALFLISKDHSFLEDPQFFSGSNENFWPATYACLAFSEGDFAVVVKKHCY